MLFGVFSVFPEEKISLKEFTSPFLFPIVVQKFARRLGAFISLKALML